ncbi:MAG TPA: serine protease [Candidatus Thermoplasmatota archaeon]|nr:serine protease [Candidatus Thermoplasmatota archaeon]
MQWTLALCLLLIVPLLAGCMVQQPKDDPAGAGSDPDSPSLSPAGGAPSRSATTAPRPSGSGRGDDGPPAGAAGEGNASLGNGSGQPRVWADIGAASIRPGVQVFADGSQCTSNFIFTSPDNATAYLGFAAHCVTKNDPNNADDGCDPSSEPLAIGTPVEVEGADHPATLAYTSWGSMQSRGGADDQECLYNDFAFAALEPRDAAKANPAMLFFGGPTALADPGDVGTLDKVLTYGDSGLRAGIAALSPHEGYVIFTPGNGGWTSEVYTAPQGIPGDSGSGVLLGGDGSALGVLVTISYAGGSNGVTTLSNAMAYAGESGVPVRLATAPLLDSGILPGL